MGVYIIECLYKESINSGRNMLALKQLVLYNIRDYKYL